MSEWRIPTHDELASLLWGSASKLGGLCKPHAALEQAYRDNFLSNTEWYWSTSVNEADDRVRVIDFRDGFCGRASQSCVGSVRLVKESGSMPSWKCGDPAKERYQDKMDGTVLDNKTGLLWMKDAHEEKVSFIVAMALQQDSAAKKVA